MFRQILHLILVTYMVSAAPPDLLNKLHDFNSKFARSIFHHTKTTTTPPPTTQKSTSNLKDFLAQLDKSANVAEISISNTASAPDKGEAVIHADKNVIIEVVTEDSKGSESREEFDAISKFYVTTTEAIRLDPTANCITSTPATTTPRHFDDDLGMNDVYAKLREVMRIVRQIFGEDISKTGGEVGGAFKNHMDVLTDKIKRLHSLSHDIVKMLLQH